MIVKTAVTLPNRFGSVHVLGLIDFLSITGAAALGLAHAIRA
jgi:hypothetical protein